MCTRCRWITHTGAVFKIIVIGAILRVWKGEEFARRTEPTGHAWLSDACDTTECMRARTEEHTQSVQ